MAGKPLQRLQKKEARLLPGEDRKPRSAVGALLRQRRMERGLGLRDVADHIRIRSNHLEAIESGRFEDLPGRTYAIGFVRSYAESLDLDGEEIVRRFRDEASGLNDATALVFPSPAPEGKVPGGIVLVVGLVLAATIYGGWFTLSARNMAIADLVPEVPERLSQWLAERRAASAVAMPGAGALPIDAQRQAERVEPVPPIEQPIARTVAKMPEPTDQPVPVPAPTIAQPIPAPALPTLQATSTAPSAPQVQPVVPAPPVAAVQSREVAVTAAPANPIPVPTRPVEAPAATSLAPQVQPVMPAPPAAAVQTREVAVTAAPANPTPAPTRPAQAPAAATTPVPLPVDTASAPAEQATAAEDDDSEETSTPPPESTASAALADNASGPPPARFPGATDLADPNIEPPGRTIATRPPAVAALPPDSARILTPPPAATAPDASGARIVIRATDESWVQVRDADRNPIMTRVLMRGDVYRVPNRPGLTLQAGNAGALEILVDGQPVPAIGPMGSVRRDVLLEPARLRAGAVLSPER